MASLNNPHTKCLRTFHNWVKQQLYTAYLHSGDALIEIGCGRGGDLFKIQHQHPAWVLNIDISAEHVEEAKRRVLGAASGITYRIEWHVGDLRDPQTFADLIRTGKIKAPASVDVISSQFSLSYFWETPRVLRNLLHWIHTLLRPGGYFIGTMPDGARMEAWCAANDGAVRSSVVSICVAEDKQRVDTMDATDAPDSVRKTDPDDPTDPTDRIDPTDRSRPPISRLNRDSLDDQKFGRALTFALQDQGSIIGTPTREFFMDWPTLVSLAAQHNLMLVGTVPFDEWYQKYHKADLSPAEMQASFLNRSFVFQKIV